MSLFKNYGDGCGKRKNLLTLEPLYQHMSSHYNRILSAKPVVDTSKPLSFKPHYQKKSCSTSASRRNCSNWCRGSYDYINSNNLSSSEQELLDRIVGSDQFDPVIFCGLQWQDGVRNGNPSVQRKNSIVPAPKTNQRSSWPLKTKTSKARPPPGDVIERHKEQFESMESKFWPRVLRTEAESKLRRMTRVYHPPKRKTLFDKEEWGSNASERDEADELDEGRTQEGKEASQASSRDSAYNGGTSSAADSRSPTPLSAKKTSTKHSGTQTEKMATKNHTRRTIHTRTEKEEDSEYVKLIHDITSEVVEKGHFTDKALSRVIRKHVSANLHLLDQTKMLEEVRKLRKRLGISSDSEDKDSIIEEAGELVRKSSLESESVAESWTAHYFELSKGGSSKNFDKISSAVNSEHNSELNAVGVLSDRRSSMPDVEEDTESSYESTIKENLLTEIELEDDQYSENETSVSDSDSSS